MSPALRVLVAHDEQRLRESAMQVARTAGYEVVGVADGDSARILLHSQPVPAALVVDVALPRVAAYELCDEIAREGLPTVVILIASVFSKTAYKRRPTSLYGAHDYVEQHHIVDQLAPKLERAISATPGGPASPIPHGRLSQTAQHRALRIQEAGEARLAFRYRDRAEGIERAQRLARLIVADVLLYCGDEVAEWRAQGAGGAIPTALADDLDEGRRLFELRVPPEIAGDHDFVGEALAELLAGKVGGG